jgi:hypothetical protein
MTRVNEPSARTSKEVLYPAPAHTAAQAAAIIGGTCKASWLKKLAREGRIGCQMIGGAYNFTEENIAEIRAYIARPARKPGPAPAAAAPPPRARARRAGKPAAAAEPPAPAAAPLTLIQPREFRRRTAMLAARGEGADVHIEPRQPSKRNVT